MEQESPSALSSLRSNWEHVPPCESLSAAWSNVLSHCEVILLIRDDCEEIFNDYHHE